MDIPALKDFADGDQGPAQIKAGKIACGLTLYQQRVKCSKDPILASTECTHF